MIPTLSRLSVRSRPGSRLRHWCSSQYLRISPLHWEFHSPLLSSSLAVSMASLRLSRRFSPLTCEAAYARFTPSNSGQRLPPTCYRGCWHVVSRGYYRGTVICSSPCTELYDPKAFFAHAALLRQAFAHCGRFPTAASRRSLGRVSVPVWPLTLSGRLPIVALVRRYRSN